MFIIYKENNLVQTVHCNESKLSHTIKSITENGGIITGIREDSVYKKYLDPVTENGKILTSWLAINYGFYQEDIELVTYNFNCCGDLNEVWFSVKEITYQVIQTGNHENSKFEYMFKCL